MSPLLLYKCCNMKHPLEKFKFCPICGAPHFIVNNDSSKRCEECDFIYYFNPRAAVVAVIRDEKGRLLVARRAHEPAKGTFDLPGGFTECGETAEESLSREVLEETGIHIHSARYLFSEPNIYTYSGFDVHTMDLFYEIVVDSSIDFCSNDDVASLQWIDMDCINHDDFGLNSIRRGIVKYMQEYSYKEG